MGIRTHDLHALFRQKFVLLMKKLIINYANNLIYPLTPRSVLCHLALTLDTPFGVVKIEIKSF